MGTRELVERLKQRLGSAISRADLPHDGRLFLFVAPQTLKPLCQYLFHDLAARYITSIGADDRPVSGRFLVAHNFAFDAEHVLCSVLTYLVTNPPRVESISEVVPGANWAEREFRDLVGIEPVGHHAPKRLVLPDGWPEGTHPLRKDTPWNFVPPEYDPEREFAFDPPPPGCVVVPFGPFHPTLDEPAHFRLYVEGERVRGCEYRGFMAHRGIEKLAESVLTYNEIPMAAERICGICGCVHNVTYAQAVEQAAALQAPPRAEFIRTIMLEIERLHSHLLWVGLAGHVVGFDTLFMQCFRIREPVMRVAETISGNRKTYALCVIGGVRWDLTPELVSELRGMLDQLEAEWRPLVAALAGDRNLQQRTRGVGVTPPDLVKNLSLLGPVARAAGVAIDCRRDHPYAAYRHVQFNVITESAGDVWSRILVRAQEVFESIGIVRQCLDKLPAGPLQLTLQDELPVGRLGVSSVEAPRGEAHHFVITGENNRPRRWRVRAPTYQNLQGVPAMIQDQQLADMTISLASIDPCFSCTDRLETIDLRSGQTRIYTPRDLAQLAHRSDASESSAPVAVPEVQQRRSSASDAATPRPVVLPLPKGQGRGEGEGNTRQIQAAQRPRPLKKSGVPSTITPAEAQDSESRLQPAGRPNRRQAPEIRTSGRLKPGLQTAVPPRSVVLGRVLKDASFPLTPAPGEREHSRPMRRGPEPYRLTPQRNLDPNSPQLPANQNQ